MEMMSPEMMHGMSIGMIVVSIALLVFLGLFVWLVVFLSGRAETGDLLIAELADRRSDAELQKFFEDSGADLSRRRHTRHGFRLSGHQRIHPVHDRERSSVSLKPKER